MTRIAGRLCVAGLLGLLGGAGAARASGFDSPHGYRIELPDGWEPASPEIVTKISSVVGQGGLQVEGAWAQEGSGLLSLLWWPGEKAAREGAALIDLAADEPRFVREFKRQAGKGLPLQSLAVRRHDPARRLAIVTGVTKGEEPPLQAYMALQATRQGMVMAYLFVKQEDEALHTSTFDALVRSLQVAPGQEYRPSPLGKIGVGLGVAFVVGIVLLSRRRQR